jgi:glutamine cyclotransferase
MPLLIFISLLTTSLFSNQITHALTLKQLLIDSKIPELKFNVINTFPHNTANFTEGIQLDNDHYYESSGLYRRSTIQKVELKSAKIVQEYKLPPQYFGEGLTFLNDKIYQLTYREKVGFVYDKNTLKLLSSFPISSMGWGLTNNGQQLIMSDGSSKLSFINLQTLKVEKTVKVSVAGNEIKRLNELEYIDGKIFANVWMTTIILIISPETGNIERWLDIASLQPSGKCPPTECVANGILHDAKASNQIYVTGKLWPYIYNIEIHE